MANTAFVARRSVATLGLLAVAKQQTHIARYEGNLPNLPTCCRASRKPCHSSICVQVAEGYRADTFYADLRGAQPPGSGWPHPLLAVPGLRTEAGGWERQFAGSIFRPVTEHGDCRVQYGDWLLKFCVSISWRILLLGHEKTSLVDLPEGHRAAAMSALDTWARFLRGEVPHPGSFEQHLLVLEHLGSYRGSPLPPNINRYAMRSIEMDAGWTDQVGFTFAKMGASPRETRSVRLSPSSGTPEERPAV